TIEGVVEAGEQRSRQRVPIGRGIERDHGDPAREFEVDDVVHRSTTVHTLVVTAPIHVDAIAALVSDVNDEMLQKVHTGSGFIAALDQSGGSTPKALKLYGIDDDAWSNDDEMFDLMHAMRSRIITSPAFTGEKVLGAILFEQTMDREIEG